MIKKFMCDKVDSESVNWVDENNRLVWFDFSRQCREQFGYKYCKFDFDAEAGIEIEEEQMNKRQLKKMRSYFRRLWLSHKVTSIERGYLSEYFHRYNFDWRGVKKLLKGRYVLSRLRADYRKLYHHPGYSDEKKDEFFQKMRYGDFLPPYEPCSAHSDVFTLQTGAIADIKFRRQE